MADVTDSPELGGPAPAESGGLAGQAPARKTGLAGSLPVRAWLRYRAWRRSRPFWAGIWLILSGAELLLIPLPIRNMGIILHIGIGGISGILIGAVLILLGLLLWFSPGPRVFYSSVAVLLAVAALVATNLGGFLIGTLLGILGGSLGFGWMPGRPERRRRRRRSTIQSSPPGTEPEHGPIQREFVLLPALAVIAGVVHLTPVTATTADPSASASASPSASASASPSAPGSASPSSAASPAPSPPAAASSSTPNPASPSTSSSPEPSVTAGSSGSASSSASATLSPSPSSTPTGSRPPFAVSTSQATLTASSASLTGFAYHGVVSVPTASGSVEMMEFSATSIVMSGTQLAVSEGGTMMTTTASSLDFDGNVLLYVSELSGDVLGSPITITPSTPLATILQWLGQVGASQLIPLQMTDVTTQQPYTSANTLVADSLQIS